MSLEAGTRLGPYVILAPIGAGGMGEVYRAADSRLGRSVAIKVLPSHRISNDQARTRFQREAHAISALSHPNICTLHDVGQQNGIDFLVMEHLEGETLSDRLSRGPLPLEEVVRYGIEIAAALDHAHRSGIVHRDLKPANVFLTKSGAKLLDFGLATLVSSNADAPTMEKALTGDGVIPGTLEFLAPEQIAGRPADARSDIFAFGNVLYRMASGRPPFSGDSTGSIIASITRDEPPPIEPAALRRLIASCLKKDPDARIQNAHDCKVALQWIQESLRDERPAPVVRSARLGLVALLAIAVLLIGVAGFIATLRSKRPPAAVRRFSIDLPAPLDLALASNFAISPDGGRIVILLNGAGGRQLYLRSLDQPEFVPIPGTANASFPFFSPNSIWIGFAAGGKLKKVMASGGAPLTICDASRFRGGSWGPDDTIVFAPASWDSGLYRVSAAGGEPKPIIPLARGERSHRWPSFLPDGKHVLFSVENWNSDYAKKRIEVADIETGKRVPLVQGGTGGRFVSGGFILFGRDNTLFAVRFNPSTLKVSGLPVPVVEDAKTHVGLGLVYADLANDGTLVYQPYDPIFDARDLVWVDRRGKETPISDQRRPYLDVSLSPDGEQLLAAVGEFPAADLWLLNIGRGSWSRIATEGKNMSPMWSPRGDRIFFSSNRYGVYNVFAIAADGGGTARQITNRDYWPFVRSVSPDGRTIIVEVQHPMTSQDLWTVDVATGRETPLVVDPADQTDGRFSPDGQWFAYTSNESGQVEIYVQHFPATGRKWSVSRRGGAGPRWSRDGKEIFYLSAGRLMAAEVTTGPTLVVGMPKVLFEGDYATDYDVAPDGKRFVMLKKATRAQPTQLEIITGAADEIARRVTAAERRE